MSTDIQYEMQIMHDSWDYKRAKFWFWPIVICFIIFFGFLPALKGQLLVYSTGSLAEDFFSMKVCQQIKK